MLRALGCKLRLPARSLTYRKLPTAVCGAPPVTSLSDSAHFDLCERVLVGVQQVSGCPWWLSITVTTFLVRSSVTLPLSAYQILILAKVEALQAEITELAKRLKVEVSQRARERGWTYNQSRVQFKRNLRRLVSGLYIRDNCHPFKASLLVWVQVPLWISFSLALRNLSLTPSVVQEQLSTGGVYWFSDLTVPDSTWIIPVCVGLSNLINVQLFSSRTGQSSRLHGYLIHALRGFSVLIVPIAATVPSSLALYWLCSSLVGLSHGFLLRAPSIRKLLLPRKRSQ
ncbi:cytochrome c oxidase assembly protein COX18, mitochondrial [Gouania willdenowi]|uniref:cytochrome c oxidase assembly protein COX18, mitochondrial n=1 Tax=Gouania willdenowi TaxID=441366 RepID=UPI0010547C4F|nr:cytochrome c oxidase assembly protein COX18, mitochondrial [Gouania willdenowi]